MPLNKDIKKVLVIGSGPIVIGQAAEFDYAGTQACRALKADGIEIVLVNSNPATIMTDNAMADHDLHRAADAAHASSASSKRKSRTACSPRLGGQTGLTLSMQLAKEGFLEGTRRTACWAPTPRPSIRRRTARRSRIRWRSIGQPCIPSKVVTTVEDALEFAEEIGYPVIVRPAFTLGGTGGGIADNDAKSCMEIAANGLAPFAHHPDPG